MNDREKVYSAIGVWLPASTADLAFGIEKAIQAARTAALREAAGAVEGYALVDIDGYVEKLASETILALISQAATEQEGVCEWEQNRAPNDWVEPGCHAGMALSCVPFKFCPYCGLPIRIRENAKE